MQQTVSDIKIDLINLIVQLTDYELLNQLQETVKNKIQKKKISEPNLVKLREGVTKEDLFTEQGNKRVNYAQIQQLVGGVEWEHSLDEMLAELD